MSRLKKIASGWLVLLCALFAGVRAGSFVFDPCRRLDGRGDIKGHQAMLTDEAAYFARVEIDQSANVHLYTFVDQHNPFVNPAANRLIGIRTDDGQESLTEPKAVTDADLYLSVFIAQHHANNPLTIHSRPLVSRVLVSAPADSYLLQWRDRSHVPHGKKKPPLQMASQYSMEKLEGYFKQNPDAVDKLLIGIFRVRGLTRLQRERVAMELDLAPTIPAQRPVRMAKQYDGGLPPQIRKASA